MVASPPAGAEPEAVDSGAEAVDEAVVLAACRASRRARSEGPFKSEPISEIQVGPGLMELIEELAIFDGNSICKCLVDFGTADTFTK